MVEWTSKPCNLQNLPRHTPEGIALRKVVREMLVAQSSSGPDGWDLFAMSTYPATPNLLVRAGVRLALEGK